MAELIEPFSDALTALKYGSSLMNEQLQSIKLKDSKENSVKEMKHKNALNVSETSDIFSRFPHSALKTPSISPGAASNSKKETTESTYSTSTNSIKELYQNIAKAPGLKSFKKIFPAVLKSPDLSLVNESSNTSVLEKSSATNGQSSIISPITRRKPRKNARPLTPDPFADSSRSRRAAAPASLKEPSLKKKMRRT
uniref:Shugoshin C-terminal domain-containing protein n=1 Tax=Panagrolaimus sp. PS1159 TaxID=55785 RepID=A0AC35F2G9_9BILA